MVARSTADFRYDGVDVQLLYARISADNTSGQIYERMVKADTSIIGEKNPAIELYRNENKDLYSDSANSLNIITIMMMIIVLQNINWSRAL